MVAVSGLGRAWQGSVVMPAAVAAGDAAPCHAHVDHVRLMCNNCVWTERASSLLCVAAAGLAAG